MKAAVLTDCNTVQYINVETPVIGKDEALIKVAYSGICGSDVHIFNGKHPIAKPPVIMGHEFSGTVEQIISDDSNIKPGDKVCAHITQYCGKCDACISGYPHLCKNLKVLGTQVAGTFAQFVKVPVSKLYKLPPQADLRLMALAEPLAVGIYAVKRAQLEVAQTAFIFGGGPIGLCCALAAEQAGASDILVCELSEKRRSFIEALGFATISPDDILEKVNDRTLGRGYDRVFETSGSKACSVMLTQIGAVRSRAVIVALASEPQPIDTWQMMRKEIDLCHMRVHTQTAYNAAVDLILKGNISEKLLKMITHDFEIEQTQQAFDLCRSTSELHYKVMVHVS